MRKVAAAPSGVLAVFDEREHILAAVRHARRAGLLRLTAFAPAYDHELVEAASPPPMFGIGPFTASAGVAGLLAGLGLTILTTLQWPTLIVGGKPIVAMPPFLVIAFEVTILFAAFATIGMLVLHAIWARPRRGAPYDARFSDASFGLWIECSASRIPTIAETMRSLGAIECRVV
jgi:molybdopterin-containing oxidoreductase family membrane subunit